MIIAIFFCRLLPAHLWCYHLWTRFTCVLSTPALSWWSDCTFKTFPEDKGFLRCCLSTVKYWRIFKCLVTVSILNSIWSMMSFPSVRHLPNLSRTMIGWSCFSMVSDLVGLFLFVLMRLVSVTSQGFYIIFILLCYLHHPLCPFCVFDVQHCSICPLILHLQGPFTTEIKFIDWHHGFMVRCCLPNMLPTVSVMALLNVDIQFFLTHDGQMKKIPLSWLPIFVILQGPLVF